MADYFVSNTGNDTTGTGTAANPWKTIDKAIGAAPAITLPGSGSTRLILRGGDTFGEAVTLGLSPGATYPLEIVGDADGTIFAGAGGSGGTGVPTWRAWSNATTPINSACLSLASKGYVTVRKIRLVGGSNVIANVIDLSYSDGFNLLDCELLAGSPAGGSARLLNVTASTTGGSGLRVRRCDFDVPAGGTSRAILIVCLRDDSPYPIDALIESCRFRGGSRPIDLAAAGGAKTATATGFSILCCTFDSPGSGAVYVGTVLASGSVTVTGCVIVAAGTGLSASTAGQIVENYNLINANTPRSTVSAGANSLTDFAPALNMEAWRLDGQPARPFLEPLAGSTALGFLPRPSGVTLDLHGRARPDPCAAGCLERVDPPAPVSGPVCIAY